MSAFAPTPGELKVILNKHGSFERGEPGGERANLRGANLIDANLIGANLRGAILIGADLSGADLSGANLIDANLRDANLIGANLRGAILIGANLIGANLRGAILIGADLSGANLIDANLIGANLIGANLRGANGIEYKLVGASPRIALAFSHYWELVLWHTDKGIVVECGCRFFGSIEAAREHWLKHKDSQRQAIVLPALQALISIASAQGWKSDIPDDEAMQRSVVSEEELRSGNALGRSF